MDLDPIVWKNLTILFLKRTFIIRVLYVNDTLGYRLSSCFSPKLIISVMSTVTARHSPCQNLCDRCANCKEGAGWAWSDTVPMMIHDCSDTFLSVVRIRCVTITYNVRTIKVLRHIAREFRRSHLLDLQSKGIQESEEIVRSNINQFVWLDFSSRDRSSDVTLTFKRTFWQERNIRDRLLLPDEFRSRFEAVRLMRKDSDLYLISLCIRVDPCQDAQRNRICRFWLWLDHFIT